jgi:pimeloyl-ACP methyl ester carboxylesterase
MSDLPIVLVHGAWHGSWCWQQLVDELGARGRRVVTVENPSSGTDAATLGDLSADVANLQSQLDAIGGPSIVVGHSYGGQVISQASAGRSDIAHLVYIAAFMADTGDSVFGLTSGDSPDWIEPVADGIALKSHRNEEIFYADVDPSAAATAAAKTGLQSISSFAEALTGAGWHNIPSSYIACEDDRAVPYPAQQAMSQRAGTTHTLKSSHSPFMSMPGAVADILAAL